MKKKNKQKEVCRAYKESLLIYHLPIQDIGFWVGRYFLIGKKIVWREVLYENFREEQRKWEGSIAASTLMIILLPGMGTASKSNSKMSF